MKATIPTTTAKLTQMKGITSRDFLEHGVSGLDTVGHHHLQNRISFQFEIDGSETISNLAFIQSWHVFDYQGAMNNALRKLFCCVSSDKAEHTLPGIG